MIDEKDLKKKIISLDFPFKIKKDGDCLAVDYKLADIERKDLLGKGKHKETYKARMSFKDGVVAYSDKLTESDLDLGAFRIFSLIEKIRGKMIDVKKKKSERNIGAKYSYKISVTEIKKKIKKAVEDSGWKFKIK